MKLWINNLTIQIPSLNYNNKYIEDSKYWNILLLLFSLFNLNQSFKDISNSIKPHTYIHMNINNLKNKNSNLQKPLPNTVTIYLFFIFIFIFIFLDCAFFSSFPFMFHQTFSNWPKYLSYMLTLNLIRKPYIPFVLKTLQEPKSMQETV